MKRSGFIFVLWLICSLSAAVRVQAQCDSIDASVQYKRGCLPILVSFIAKGAPKGSFFYWDYGKGPIAGNDTFLETFTSPGTYDVVLKVILPNGSSCIINKPQLLELQALSSVNFSAPVTFSCTAPYTFALSDYTTNVVRREWYVDGVQIPDGTSLVRLTFSSPGSHTITLKDFDANGCSKSLTKTNYLRIADPVAADFCTTFEEDPTHKAIYARFTPNVQSTSPITRYVWSFPGGSPSSSTSPVPPLVTYSSLSVARDVTLTVTTQDGCTAKYTKQSLIQKYYTVGSTSGCMNSSFSYTNLADNNNRILSSFSFSSNFGLKTSYLGSDKYSFRFDDIGQANLIVQFKYSDSRCYDVLTIPTLFTVKDPKAEFTSSNAFRCNAPATVDFSAVYGSPSTGKNTYTWRIYDTNWVQLAGSPIISKGPDTTFLFSNPGVYNVSLKVTNTNGCSDSVGKFGFVRIGTPKAAFSIIPTAICPGDKVTIINNTSRTDNPTDPLEHFWRFQHQDSIKIYYDFYGRNPDVSIPRPGVYTVYYYIGKPGICYNSTSIKNALTVNGVEGDITVGSPSGCRPFSTALSVTIKEKVPNIPTNILRYAWEVFPKKNVSIADSTQQSTTVRFLSNGVYKVRLSVFDASGCRSYLQWPDSIAVGTLSSFTIATNGCQNKDIFINNLSRSATETYKWIVSPSVNASILPADTVRTPRFRFSSDGCYTISLITGRRGTVACNDTSSRKICILSPQVSISSPDTSRRCAPIDAHFHVTAQNAVSYLWDFGDGTTLNTTDLNPVHTYTKNNPSGFTVKVTATSSFGCQSVFTFKNFIKLYGPVPSFKLSADKGCTKLNVHFTNTSRNVAKYYFQYGDNSPIEHDAINDHSYEFGDFSMDSNVFVPTMIALDDSNCISTYKSSVVLYRPPVVGFKANNVMVCQPSAVTFKNTTKYAQQYYWDFDGDGRYDDSVMNPTFVYTKPGKFSVKLKAITDHGCTDSLILPQYITVFPKPKAAFTVRSKTVCFQDSVHFIDRSLSDSAIVSWQWKFGDGSRPDDISYDKDPTYQYMNPGFHTVRLIIKNSNGCIDTAIYPNFVQTLDTIPPDPDDIYYATVLPDRSIKVIFTKARAIDFGHYHLYRDLGGSIQEVYTSDKINDTIYTESPGSIDVNGVTGCYFTILEDNCGYLTRQSVPHCLIRLKATISSALSIRLNWTAYTGWKSIKAYEIYRREDNGAFKLLTTVPSSTLSYTDSMLCDKMYSYYISALHPSANYTSESNRDSARPPYIYQLQPLEITNTTVQGNSEIVSRWTAGIQPNIRHYIVDRYRQSSGWQYGYAYVTQNTFVDRDVDVQAESYRYRVSVEDLCGNISALSNTGSSILLQASVMNDTRYLDWNRYRNWSLGEMEYVIQVKNRGQKFTTLAHHQPGDTTFADDSVHEEIDTATVYRVLAIENNPALSQRDTSISNLRPVILPSRVFIPNAFTPQNGDTLNNVFIPVGVSIFRDAYPKSLRYNFRIYNRWGEKVFETQDIRKGWDGRYKGNICEEGAYFYLVDAYGYDRLVFHRKGQLYIIR